jgi:hypothetical protein
VIKKVLKLVVFVFFANAVYQVGPVSVHYFQFKDALEELALFSPKATDVELVERTMTLAEENSIPLEREYVEIQRNGLSLQINATYIVMLQFLPGTPYKHQFDVAAKALR